MIWSRAAYAALLLVPETIKVAKVALPEAGITAPPGQADDVQVGYQGTGQSSLESGVCSSCDQNPRIVVQLVLIKLVLLHCAARAT